MPISLFVKYCIAKDVGFTFHISIAFNNEEKKQLTIYIIIGYIIPLLLTE